MKSFENRVYLTNEEIEKCCFDLKEIIKKKYPYYSNHIDFMYLYGCRIGELFDYRISFDGMFSKVLIAPQKSNNVRVLEMIGFEIPQMIENINITQDNFYINKRNLQRIIEKENPYRILKCGEKKIGAHLFRHNWIRRKISEGLQITNIDNLLGYTKQTVADTYAVSRIYYEY